MDYRNINTCSTPKNQLGIALTCLHFTSANQKWFCIPFKQLFSSLGLNCTYVCYNRFNIVWFILQCLIKYQKVWTLWQMNPHWHFFESRSMWGNHYRNLWNRRWIERFMKICVESSGEFTGGKVCVYTYWYTV